METVKIKLRGGMLPKKEHTTDAAYDLCIPQDWCVKSGTQAIPLGFSMELPDEWCALIFGRSGVELKGVYGVDVNECSHKRFPDCHNKLGLIDSGYRGEVRLIVRNDGEPFMLEKGSSIAQMLLMPAPAVRLVETDNLNESDRGVQGFNS